mgnify:CR=1 FL=1
MLCKLCLFCIVVAVFQCYNYTYWTIIMEGFAHLARTIPPSLVGDAFNLFDDEVRQCFAECTAVDTPDFAWQQAQLSLRRGGLGLRRVSYHSPAANLASATNSGISYEVCRYMQYSLPLYPLFSRLWRVSRRPAKYYL